MVEEQISVYPILVNDQYQNQSEGVVLLSHRVLSSLGSVKEEGAFNQEKAVLT